MPASKQLSPHRWGAVGGPILERQRASRNPPIGRGIHVEGKCGRGPGSDLLHSGNYRPPNSLKQVVGFRGGAKGGGLGGLDQNSLGDVFIRKIMNLKGDKSTIQPLGVRYTNSPQMGVYGGFPFLQAHVALI